MDIGHEAGELSGQKSAPIRKRKYETETQPTPMSTGGAASLPPVWTRVPVADQYAIGIAQPDTDLHPVDPTVWKRGANGFAFGENLSDRREAQLSLREKLADEHTALGLT